MHSTIYVKEGDLKRLHTLSSQFFKTQNFTAQRVNIKCMPKKKIKMGEAEESQMDCRK